MLEGPTLDNFITASHSTLEIGWNSKKNDIKPRTIMLNSAPCKHLKLRNFSLLSMTMYPSITLLSKTKKNKKKQNVTSSEDAIRDNRKRTCTTSIGTTRPTWHLISESRLIEGLNVTQNSHRGQIVTIETSKCN